MLCPTELRGLSFFGRPRVGVPASAAGNLRNAGVQGKRLLGIVGHQVIVIVSFELLFVREECQGHHR